MERKLSRAITIYAVIKYYEMLAKNFNFVGKPNKNQILEDAKFFSEWIEK